MDIILTFAPSLLLPLLYYSLSLLIASSFPLSSLLLLILYPLSFILSSRLSSPPILIR
jgi:hypothetical protein